MDDLRFGEISRSLDTELPELQGRYEQRLSWWQGPESPGQYIVFGFVVKPALWELLSSGNDPTLLKRMFRFFERMATSSDTEVVNLLQVGIFESLVAERDRLTTAWGFMGETTKGVARRIACLRDCEQNLPSD